VITDIHMPDMDGFRLVERIRSVPDFSTVAIAMLTSGETRGDIERSRTIGVSAHLTKPARRFGCQIPDGIEHSSRPGLGSAAADSPRRGCRQPNARDAHSRKSGPSRHRPKS
jgi:PleD family two-component response regulator